MCRQKCNIWNADPDLPIYYATFMAHRDFGASWLVWLLRLVHGVHVHRRSNWSRTECIFRALFKNLQIRVNAYKYPKFQLLTFISFRDKQDVPKFNVGDTSPLPYPVYWNQRAEHMAIKFTGPTAAHLINSQRNSPGHWMVSAQHGENHPVLPIRGCTKLYPIQGCTKAERWKLLHWLPLFTSYVHLAGCVVQQLWQNTVPRIRQ